MKRDPGFWMIQGPGWLLFLYLVYAQAIPAIDYELGVSMGTQESSESITAVGVAFWYGFALGDLAVYIANIADGYLGWPPFDVVPKRVEGLERTGREMAGKTQEELEMTFLDLAVHGDTAVI